MRGIATATFFALIFAAGHLTLEIRDHRGDFAHGIRTNAVAFGKRRTFAASLALFTLAQALFLALALQGILPRPLAALVALYPMQLYWSLETRREGFHLRERIPPAGALPRALRGDRSGDGGGGVGGVRAGVA